MNKENFKIACLGNMNNIIAPTAQYLAEMGHEVDLFLLHEFEHFVPEADYDDPSLIKFNTKKLDMDFGKVLDFPISLLEKNLIGYDFYIGTDYAPAILARLNIRIDMFAWAGTDLYEWPFYKSRFMIPQHWEMERILVSNLQRIGIKNAKAIPMSLNNDFILKKLDILGFNGQIVSPLPFLFYPHIENLKSEDYQEGFLKTAQNLRKNSDILLVQQSRQWWATAPSHISKGNDIFLKGVAKFVQKNPSVKVGIILFEYGDDVGFTKELLKELKLDDNCIWAPLMFRKDLLKTLKLADIGVGLFGSESCYLYCSNAEIIASNVMYMGHRDDKFCESKNIDLYPMLNANSEDEIAEKLEYYHSYREEVKVQTHNAFNWLIDYNEKSFLNQVSNLLEAFTVQKLAFNDRCFLVVLKTKLLFVTLINKLVLMTKIKFLKKSILEWEK